MAEIVVKEQTIIGSRCGNFKMALQALSGRRQMMAVDDLVSGVYPLKEGKEGFKMASRQGVLKIQIVMDN